MILDTYEIKKFHPDDPDEKPPYAEGGMGRVAFRLGFLYHICLQVGLDPTKSWLVYGQIMSSLEFSPAELTALGLPQDQAEAFVAVIGKLDQRMTPARLWQWMTRNLLRPEHPMEVHEYLHSEVFAD